MSKCVLAHRHFILPIPPTYVTEYEDSYRWPPSYAYDQFRNYIGRPTEKFSADGSITSCQLSLWEQLNDVAAQLSERGCEQHLLQSVKEVINSRRLDSILEYAYRHFQETLKVGDPQLFAEPSSDPYKVTVACTTKIGNLSPDVIFLCKKFVELIDAIKAV